MTDATARIKNLSIAVERLSRQPRTDGYANEVLDLLLVEIQTEKEKKGLYKIARPAKSPTDATQIQP